MLNGHRSIVTRQLTSNNINMTNTQPAKNRAWHIIAVLIIAIWGTTFISTKVLINNGLAPSQIFLIRFTIAYLGIWTISHNRLFSDSIKDELKLFILGITGGTIYFWAENTALAYSQTNNVSFLVCTSPLMTSLLAIAVGKLKMTKNLTIGTLLALSGMALVIFNGQFVLRLSPIGDALALLAAFSWAVYSLIMGELTKKYPSAFISRKVFIYGIMGIIPVLILEGNPFPTEVFKSPTVYLNLAFLAIVASLGCFVLWNKVISKIGVVSSTNYIYLNPMFTLIGSVLILSERVTILSITGSLIILLGVWFAGKGTKE